ncbi:MAG: membrane protein insertion efficiency factor YidD [Actinobacteria bacterium]|nr:membrane protein insertion efficiency factor YidD [Actinomycetota bacterium]
MKALLVGFIKMYQKWISPMFPPRCKYYPSCSSYAATAISTHGVKGVFMAVWRLLRCNPWSYGGVDYVPNSNSASRLQTPVSTLVSKGETQ